MTNHLSNKSSKLEIEIAKLIYLKKFNLKQIFRIYKKKDSCPIVIKDKHSA